MNVYLCCKNAHNNLLSTCLLHFKFIMYLNIHIYLTYITVIIVFIL